MDVVGPVPSLVRDVTDAAMEPMRRIAQFAVRIKFWEAIISRNIEFSTQNYPQNV